MMMNAHHNPNQLNPNETRTDMNTNPDATWVALDEYLPNASSTHPMLYALLHDADENETVDAIDHFSDTDQLILDRALRQLDDAAEAIHTLLALNEDRFLTTLRQPHHDHAKVAQHLINLAVALINDNAADAAEGNTAHDLLNLI